MYADPDLRLGFVLPGCGVLMLWLVIAHYLYGRVCLGGPFVCLVLFSCLSAAETSEIVCFFPLFLVCCGIQEEAARKRKEAEWERKELARIKREKKKEKREKDRKEAQDLAFLLEQEDCRAEVHMYGNR